MPSRKEICENARAVIGYPYVFGGSSEENGGFDCSGLVQYAYKKSGINIPRTTYEQFKVGKEIRNKADLIEGDLIFNFDENGVAQHVFIYSGNGKVIEAKVPGTFVSEHSNWNWEGRGVRIINDESSNKEPIDNTEIYRVIAGSYKNRENASSQQNRLLKFGFESFIAVYKSNEIIYRVVVGSFKDRSYAIKRQKELSDKGILSFLLVYND